VEESEKGGGDNEKRDDFPQGGKGDGYWREQVDPEK